MPSCHVAFVGLTGRRRRRTGGRSYTHIRSQPARLGFHFKSPFLSSLVQPADHCTITARNFIDSYPSYRILDMSRQTGRGMDGRMWMLPLPGEESCSYPAGHHVNVMRVHLKRDAVCMQLLREESDNPSPFLDSSSSTHHYFSV